MNDTPVVKIIGAGLAGCEAAYQAAKLGVKVELYEMKPVKFSPAHHNPDFAELVCSNSLRSNDPSHAVGLLQEELSAMGWGSDENLYTVPGEYLPPEVFKEDAEKIQDGVIRMGKKYTYKEIKELLGSCGYCIDINGISDPPYASLPDNPAYVYKFRWVIKDGAGSFASDLLVDFHAPAEGGEYFDDMIASCVEVIEAYW